MDYGKAAPSGKDSFVVRPDVRSRPGEESASLSRSTRPVDGNQVERGQWVEGGEGLVWCEAAMFAAVCRIFPSHLELCYDV